MYFMKDAINYELLTKIWIYMIETYMRIHATMPLFLFFPNRELHSNVIELVERTKTIYR